MTFTTQVIFVVDYFLIFHNATLVTPSNLPHRVTNTSHDQLIRQKLQSRKKQKPAGYYPARLTAFSVHAPSEEARPHLDQTPSAKANVNQLSVSCMRPQGQANYSLFTLSLASNLRKMPLSKMLGLVKQFEATVAKAALVRI